MTAHTPGPATDPDLLQQMHDLLAEAESDAVLELSAPDGQTVRLPRVVVDALVDVVEALRSGHEVSVIAGQKWLTTQEAADILGVSRPTLVKLLETGEIPFEQPGLHRRVRPADVLAYQERARAERRESLKRMMKIAAESGMYELTEGPPLRTR